MFKKNAVWVAMFAAVCGTSITAVAAEGESMKNPTEIHSPHSITGNLGFTTDYTFRGISQNFRNPAIQGGFDYAHSSGVFLGTWASAISSNQYSNASMEWDFYGGYNGKVSDDLGYSVGLISVVYPGGKTNPAGLTRKWDTTEWNIGATWKGLNVKYSQTLTNWFGISGALGGGFEPTMWNPGDTQATGATGRTTADTAGADLSSKGSGYIELNYSYEFADKLVASAHVGHQKLKNYGLLSYTDYKLGVSKDIGGYVFGLAYTKTNASDNNLYHVKANGDDKNLRDGIVALSVTRSF